ncbi:unnamed protein product, partial [Rotaria sordida]
KQLKRLPEDFRQESHILTEGHIEHYKSKLHAKRFINEREELKKRIDFVARNKKEQIKRLNNLQKQQRIIHILHIILSRIEVVFTRDRQVQV